MKLFLILILFRTISAQALSCPVHRSMGITNPQNFYMIGADEVTSSSVTEESFNRHFYNIFFQNNNELQTFPLPVIPAADWEKPYFTAYTVENDGVMTIGFWGGMARIPGMNDEGVALITCHEVGHILGGLPRFKLKNYEQLSNEGQSDYYATSVCLKKYFLNDHETILELNKTQGPLPLAICLKRFQSRLDQAVCLRSLKGIQAFAQVLGYMQKDGGTPVLGALDLSIVPETQYDAYPSHQCRIDTMVAGVIGDARPKCWFR